LPVARVDLLRGHRPARSPRWTLGVGLWGTGGRGWRPGWLAEKIIEL